LRGLWGKKDNLKFVEQIVDLHNKIIYFNGFSDFFPSRLSFFSFFSAYFLDDCTNLILILYVNTYTYAFSFVKSSAQLVNTGHKVKGELTLIEVWKKSTSFFSWSVD
jgi:hypothetical protein